ncbi:hypothetical protein C8T65DRAFT_698883 [Cerioporus squamosus]|nr:hypothetical protein C8T65DRAFT_698883 [Cerioporus squamosus]
MGTIQVRRVHGVGGLNHDVWKLVLEDLSAICEKTNHLLQVMRVCRAFYQLGLKALLDRGVALDSEDTVESFCHFITGRNSYCAPLLKSLVLELPHISETTARALCSVVRRTTRLRQLSISHFEALLLSAPDAVDIFADMESIRLLTVAAKEPGAVVPFLTYLRSPLTSVSLIFDPIDREPGHHEVLWDFNPLALLELSQSTLRSAHVDHVAMSGWADTSFPNLEALEVTAVRLPSTDVLARIFPKLSTFHMHHVFWADGSNDMDTAIARRNTNILAQERSGSWSQLASVTGSDVDIFSLGLVQSPVSKMVVYADPLSGADPERVILQSLLEFTPKLTTFELITSEDLSGLGWPLDRSRMYELARMEKMPAERKSLISTTVQRFRDVFDEHRFVIKESACKLTELTMTVRVPCPVRDCWFPDAADSDALQQPQECPVWEALRKYNLTAEAGLTCDAAATLQEVHLRVRHNHEEVQRRTRGFAPLRG